MEVTVTLTIKAQVSSQEEADYLLDPTTNSPSIPFMADIVDTLDGVVIPEILAINGQTPKQIVNALQAPEIT